MGSNMRKMQGVHGTIASGKGSAVVKTGSMGISPATGTVMESDYKNRKVGCSQIGDDSGPSPAKTRTIKQLGRTGGQGRKFAGKMAYEKATGTT